MGLPVYFDVRMVGGRHFITHMVGVLMARKYWSQVELDYLEKHYGKMQTSELSAALCRSPDSIYRKAKELELTIEAPGRPRKSIFDHCRKNSRMYKFDQLLKGAISG
ncbi:hypothetical protein [Serratia rubidaea]|uniref:hypothetical protein n=1 Tax=Serratia rubidaea TaxID=61652 RepID=UPI00242DF0B6|nr:hypothetical protein [Serratia rubidaea]MCR0998693.1 hypothetical protein [Serratia rubidaea]